MNDALDLDRYPLEQRDSAASAALLDSCRRDMAANGLFSDKERIGFHGRTG